MAEAESGSAARSDSQDRLRIWYATGLGTELHALVRNRAMGLLRGIYGLHCLQLGGTWQGSDFLGLPTLVHRVRVQTGAGDDLPADPLALPLAAESIDLVVLCHELEFCPAPHALLREVERILARDGHVLTISFNPWSLLGLSRLCRAGDALPRAGRFYSGDRIAEWCAVLGMRTLRRETCWLRPPLHRTRTRRWLGFLEYGEALLPGCGAVHLLLVRKQSIPLDPIVDSGTLRRRRVVTSGVVRPTSGGVMQRPGMRPG